ncbi:MAG: GTP pyrophosphokinase family protein [Firmicutes bacterium]|nr:GTP pyrophosphokinase family protein [Bacillota bacterium]
MDNVQKEVITLSNLPVVTQQILDTAETIRTELMHYSCAIREVKTKLDVLSDEFSSQRKRNPIEFITSRVKTPESIVNKLRRKGFPVSMESAVDNLYDIAGVRVICSFVDDIYAVRDMLANQDDVTVLMEKDYIRNPKPNGYRSLHLIISIPVFFSTGRRDTYVEVQIRTIAMDFWASLEHDLKYNKEVPDVDRIQRELKKCADDIAATDQKMMRLRDEIDSMRQAEELGIVKKFPDEREDNVS